MKSSQIPAGLIWFSLIIMLFWASLYVYVPLLPVYAASLQGGSLAAAGLVVSMYGLTQLILRIPLGLTSDRINARKAFLYLGFAFSALSAVGLAFTPTVGGAAAFRGLGGAAASSWVILTTLYAGFFPPDAAVRATSLAVFLNLSASMTASFSGGLIAQSAGTRAAFLTAAGLALAGLAILPLAKPPATRKTSQPGTQRAPFRIGAYLILISAAAAVAQYIAYATSYGYTQVLADRLGATPAQLGSLTAIMQLAFMLTSLVLSLVIRSRSEKAIALGGIALVGLACFLTLAARQVNTLFAISFLQGIGQGMSYPVLMGMAIKPVPENRRATAMGIFQAVYAIGMFAGPAVSAWISAKVGLLAVFSTAGALALVALPLLILFLRVPPTEAAEPADAALS